MAKTLKIGVLTMHRVVNYGSFLQSFATQQLIQQLGYECELIDYKFPNEWQYTHGLYRKKGLRLAISSFLRSLNLPFFDKKNYVINKAIKKYYNLSDKSYNSPEEINKQTPYYDVYVVGSDQTWNVKHTRADPTFLLSFVPKGRKKISFSASIAGEKLLKENEQIFSDYLSKFEAISIRDRKGLPVVEKLSGKNVKVTLDPTLMLNESEWTEFANNKSNKYKERHYILFYMLSYAFEPRPYIYSLLNKLQMQTGIEVYSFTDIPKEFNIKYSRCKIHCIEEFVQLFKFASYVVTSSFHGTAFAVNFGIPLYSVVKALDADDDRQLSLLQSLDIMNCVVPMGREFEKIDSHYNKEREQRILRELREQSLNYLKENL